MIKRTEHLVAVGLFILIVASAAFSIKEVLYLSNDSDLGAAIKAGLSSKDGLTKNNTDLNTITTDEAASDASKETLLDRIANSLKKRTVNLPAPTLQAASRFKGGSTVSFDKKGNMFVSYPWSNEKIDITGLKEKDPVKLILVLNSNNDKESVKNRFSNNVAAQQPSVRPYVFIEVPKGELNTLESKLSDLGVKEVWQDHVMLPILSTSIPHLKNPQGWQQVEQQAGMVLDGSGVKIAILDSGIDPNHPDFMGRVIASASFTGDPNTSDWLGHGTAVAGVAAGSGAGSGGLYKGMAPAAQILNGVVFNPTSAAGQESWLILGIEWAVANGANVINYSGENPYWGGDGTSPGSQTVNWAFDQGVVFVCGAGNSGNGNSAMKMGSPGVAEKSITAGGVSNDDSDTYQYYSSPGPTGDGRMKPDIVAESSNVITARSANSNPNVPVGQYYASVSGTSMASPFVAGIAALLKQAHPNWSAAQIKNAILLSAVDMYASNPGTPAHNGAWKWGLGRVDAVKAAKTDIVLSNNGEINFELLSQNTASKEFTVVSGSGTITENDPYLTITPSQVATGTVVTATVSFPANFSQAFYDAPFTITTAAGAYHGIAFFSRANVITFKVHTSDPNLKPYQPFYISLLQGTSYSSGNGLPADTIGIAVPAGTTRFAAVSPSVVHPDGSVISTPFVLTSQPITISGYGQQVSVNLDLDSAYQIPFDLSSLGAIEKSSNVIYLSPSGSPYSAAASISTSNPFSKIYLNDTRPGDRINVAITTVDSITNPSKVYNLNWKLENITGGNHPSVLLPASTLQHYSLSFIDPNPNYSGRTIGFGQENAINGMTIVNPPPSVSLDLFANFGQTYTSTIFPSVTWKNSVRFTNVGPLPFPYAQSQTIVVGPVDTADIVAPPTPSVPSVNISENVSFDWSDVSDPSGVTYQVHLANTLGSVVYEDKMYIQSSNYTVLQSLLPGTYSVKVRAIDNSGNFGLWTQAAQFQIVDTIPGSEPGDVNGDGHVNVDDLLMVINGWGPCPGTCPADLTHNHLIDVDDLLMVINNWS